MQTETGENRNILTTDQIIRIVRKMLAVIDPRLINHGERVAWLTRKIVEAGNLQSRFDMGKLFLLSLMHDIGAYKTEEIDRIFEFELSDVCSHSLYGYLFMKIMTPLGESAEAIRYHHMPYKKIKATGSPMGEYAALIAFADRTDIAMLAAGTDFDKKKLATLVPDRLSPEYYEIFLYSDAHGELEQCIFSGSFLSDIEQWTQKLDFPAEQAFQFLRMMIYLMDFRSPVTVTHTINTSALAVAIGRRMKCSSRELDELFTAALLHDIGKLAVPVNILESSSGLDNGQAAVMRMHVVKTDEMIRGIVDDKLADIAVRHHEKLDGSGYPDHLTGADLTLQQRIMAVADILSALSGNRSYKEAFPKEKTTGIIASMARNGKLDQNITTVTENNYDEIMQEMDRERSPLVAAFGQIEQEYARLAALGKPERGCRIR